MNEILKLEALGYIFSIDEGKIHYSFNGENPNPNVIRPLLNEVRERRDEAIRYIEGREKNDGQLLPTKVAIEDISDFLTENGLSIVNFEWSRDGEATLILEPINNNSNKYEK